MELASVLGMDVDYDLIQRREDLFPVTSEGHDGGDDDNRHGPVPSTPSSS